MLSLSHFPDWLKSGELYSTLTEASDTDYTEGIIPKVLKTNLSFECLEDVLKAIDTCAFAGVDWLPNELFHFCKNAVGLQDQMSAFERGEIFQQYHYFIVTPEYQAVQLCVASQNTICYINEYDLFETALNYGNLPLIKHLIDEEYGEIGFIEIPIRNGNITVVKFLLAQFPQWANAITKNHFYSQIAAGAGQIEMLGFLRELNIPWTIFTMIEAVKKNRIECIEYLIDNGCPIGDHTVDWAIMNDSLESIRLLVEKGGKSVNYPVLLNYAAERGNFEMMVYLHEKGAPYGDWTAYIAKMSGNDACFSFAISIGAPYIGEIIINNW